MTKFVVPPVTLVLAWLIAFATIIAGQATFLAAHFLLEFTLCASLLGCIYVVIRLFPQRSDARVRVLFVLNIAGIVAFFIFMLIFGFVARETSNHAM